MTLTTCPTLANLERLFLGGLHENEAESLEQHVLECAGCLEQLKTLDRSQTTLTGAARDDTACDGLAATPVVADLIDKLQQLRPALAHSAGASTPPPVSNDLEATAGPVAAAVETPVRLTDFLAPAQADDELGRLGKYRILEILGHGGMGVVYRAEDSKLKRTVAIKAMLPAVAASANAGQRFLREAEAMAQVEHDHIVRIYQIDEDRGVPFLAMEFLKGESLDERLQREQRLPLAEVLRIGREIAAALDAAHTRGLIHRDVKPANIWLETPPPTLSPRGSGPGEGGRVKILDFGLARAATQAPGLTLQGAIVGTPAYMAPEQARGAPVDARCDLFSLGVVLYRLCTGQPAFKGDNNVAMVLSVAMDNPVPPIAIDPELPQELSDLVMKLLEKDPVQRPLSAAEVVHALQGMEKKLARQREAADATIEMVPAALVPPVVSPSRRRRLPLLVAAAAVVFLLLVAATAAVFFITTDQGTFAVETDDPDFAFHVAKDGAVTLEDRTTKGTYVLKVVRRDKDEYTLEVTDTVGKLTFTTKTFTIKRGEKAALTAWVKAPPPAPPAPPPPVPGNVEDAWPKMVAALPAEKQVEEVAAMLKKRNPEFDAKVTHKVEGGSVTELAFSADYVTDLSPVRALPGLRRLFCRGSAPGKKSQLDSLAPLKGLPLTDLDCSFTKVSDLSPLKGMPLKSVECMATRVADLSPLKGMPLSAVRLDNCRQVSDLSPLKDMPLTKVSCTGTQVSDLSPLKDMKLTSLYFSATPVTDLSPLKDMPLKNLQFHDAPVSDLSPLKDMQLTSLQCQHTKVTDLSVLQGMPLTGLQCDFEPERDAVILRSIKTLESINLKRAKDFWKEVDDKKP